MLGIQSATAKSTKEFSVQVSASVQASPARITLHWPQDSVATPSSYTVYRRAPGQASWGNGTTLPGTATSFTDSNVAAGKPYEYQIVKRSADYTGYGYIYSGINVPLTENRGKLLLVIDNTHAAELATELARLQQDLVGDGWTVTRLGVNRNDTPVQVKQRIKAEYLADPQNVKAVFLFGHVPVPYSGNIVPDGHYPDHQGAWPCDGYYADMNGAWTDNLVNETSAADVRNHNVPGDGKFDQSKFPSTLKLMIGRVDLANLPGRMTANGPATFPSEVELLRNYLNKAHNFRHKLVSAPDRAVVGDYFGVRDGEAFAASGWRNFAPFVGSANITTLEQQGTWISTLGKDSYLWAYGCGSGSYTSIGGIGSLGEYADGVTTELVRGQVKAMFTMLYGSWLGDWDSEDNIQRAVLALPDYGLVSVWSGRPHWFLQHMALGETIGFSTRLTQNDGFNGLYRNEQNNCKGWTHIALMGDPTLRMHMVAPPNTARATQQGASVHLSWLPSAEAVMGYNIYRAPSANGPFVRLNNTPVTGTTFTDANGSTGNFSYMIRAVKLQETASGTYVNYSQGAFATPAQPSLADSATGPSASVTVEQNVEASLVDAAPLGRDLKPTGDTIWFNDSLPAGARGDYSGGDRWTWVTGNPAPQSGTHSHQSANSATLHQHYFTGATAPMTVAAGDTIYTYVYINPQAVPTELMLQFHQNGSWEHRAYWGANLIPWGDNNTASRRYMGPMPAAGQWVRLEFPASQIGLEGKTVSGMAFTMFGGQATFDNTGKANNTVVTPPPTQTNSTPSADVIWVNDALPAGSLSDSSGGDSWNWVTSNPAPQTGTRSHQSAAVAGLHQHFFGNSTAPLAVNAGDTLYTYVYIDPANVPSELMLQFNQNGSWEHRAYWGSDTIPWGVNGTVSRRYMGAMPPAGQWVRLQIPASQVGLEGKTVSGMAFTLYNGRVTWDNTGKAAATSITNTPPPASTNTPPPATNNPPATATTNFVSWVDDALPLGAVSDASGGDAWTWTTSNPNAQSGTRSHQSSFSGALHQHFFRQAANTLSIGSGDILYTYVYIDPANVPSELMLQWNENNSWEHRAYWGANNISWGTDGTASRRYMGPMPPAGQWVRLEVPASQVGLEGKTLNGMAFTLYGGRVTWDNSGKATVTVPPVTGTNPPPVTGTNPPPVVSTNPPPVITNTPPAATNSIPLTNSLTGVNNWLKTTVVDATALQNPTPGTHALRILSPTLLELKLVNTKDPNPARVTQWDLVNSSYQFSAPAPGSFVVTANGQNIAVQSVGFKRRPMYAPLAKYDLRIDNSLFLVLASPLSDNQTVAVSNPGGTIITSGMQFTAVVDPLRFNPAIHVNQEGYMPGFAKKAMVGYYLGNIGEFTVPVSAGYKIVDANSGATVHTGALQQRLDRGWTYSPAPYTKVYEADFTAFNTPGQYRLVVPGLGASLPFSIHSGIAMNFARTYALGLYHQRCGTDNKLPFTRFTHAPCHTAPAAIPATTAFSFTWSKIAEYANTINGNNPPQIAPRLTDPSQQRFPFVRTGTVDCSGGHHDAGDYSKYMTDATALIHTLMFAVDSMPGVAQLDNLGIPESGDGISDLLQEAKWEADYVAKMQDSDGGFYFITYPQNREYESDKLPENGDPQVVWPKTSSSTAAAVAALAQCASSPAFKAAYPQTAASYLQKAQLGWQFLLNAINQHGKAGIYQKLTHYGDLFTDEDELAWAACEIYLATGDANAHALLQQWFDPSNPATFRWGWWRLAESYGNAIRSYAFAVKSGRRTAAQVNSTYLAKCQAQVVACGDDNLKWGNDSAYGTSFPEATKAVQAAGWYFSSDQAFDITAAYQLNPKPEYLAAILANMNYEGGCNPHNVSYVTGLGWRQQRDIVHQYGLNDRRSTAPSGIPVGSVNYGFAILPAYGTSLRELCYPQDTGGGMQPFYDRWGDSWNVSAEFVLLNQARSLASLAFIAAQTPLKTQAWKSVNATITVTPVTEPAGSVKFSLSAPGVDLSGARIIWETRDAEPTMGQTFTFTPRVNGSQWVEAEAVLPDGRRVFAETTFNASVPNVTWIDDTVPSGGQTAVDGGDVWNWVTSNPAPISGTRAHQSAIVAGMHQHFFHSATATMNVPSSGATLYAWVYLDPANPPSEIMLQWNNGSWDHRAYWGANNLSYGTDGTASRRYMGPLPATGQWVKLQVPASQVGLAGTTVTGMAFTLFNGRATWDAAGFSTN